MAAQKIKVAVVCANLPNRNTGMVTVDHAAQMIVPALCQQAEVKLYAFGKGNPMPYGADEIVHGHIDLVENSDEFLQSDVILYWGDFVHSRSYWVYDMDKYNDELRNLEAGARKAAVQKILENRSRFIFLNDWSDEKLRQVIVFGSTIITNEADDAADPPYQRDFRRFFSRIGGVFFRDALSAAKISPFRQQEVTLACDCAFLLTPEHLSRLKDFRQPAARGGVGVFYGRSPGKLWMLLFARLVARLTGQNCVWIPWFSSTAKMRKVAGLLGYSVPEQDMSPGALLAQLAGCSFVITDTYHLCVNAWRMGIPAVCIGQGAAGQQTSLADKKKEILYEMYGACHFYVFLEAIRSPLGLWRTARSVAQTVAHEQMVEQVSDNVQEHRAAALERLRIALSAALERAAAKQEVVQPVD